MLAPNEVSQGEADDGADHIELGEQGENEKVTINDEEAQEDCEPMKKAPQVYLPNPREIEEHNVTHYPYRSWCKWCV